MIDSPAKPLKFFSVEVKTIQGKRLVLPSRAKTPHVARVRIEKRTVVDETFLVKEITEAEYDALVEEDNKTNKYANNRKPR